MPTNEKSEEQRLAAAITIAKKQSLIQALGLTFCDPDPDENAKIPSGVGVTQALIYAGLFLVAHELIKKLVVAPIKFFYKDTAFDHKLPFTTYEADVLFRDKNVFEASLLYLRDHMKALTPEQVSTIQEVRKRRNLLAHELSRRLASLDPVGNEKLIAAARDALFELSNHWTYVELGCDPEFAALEPDWSEVYGEDFELLDRIIDMTRDLRCDEGGMGFLRRLGSGNSVDDGNACDPAITGS